MTVVFSAMMLSSVLSNAFPNKIPKGYSKDPSNLMCEEQNDFKSNNNNNNNNNNKSNNNNNNTAVKNILSWGWEGGGKEGVGGCRGVEADHRDLQTIFFDAGDHAGSAGVSNSFGIQE